MRILLIEDSEGTAKTLQWLLERGLSPVEVVHVSTYSAGLGVAKTGRFDVVIQDLVIPDAPPAKEAIAGIARTGSPVIVCTGSPENVRETCLSAGADEVVHKGEMIGNVRLLPETVRCVLWRAQGRKASHE